MSDQRLDMGVSGEALPSVSASGWSIAGTWVLTGERKDGRVDPEHGVFADGYGALELVARVERLAFSTPSTPAEPVSPLAVLPVANADRAATVGLAWYLNRYLKISASAVFESISDPARSPRPGAGHVPTAVVQFQAAL